MICSNCLIEPICEKVCGEMEGYIKAITKDWNDLIYSRVPLELLCGCRSHFYEGVYNKIHFTICEKCKRIFTVRYRN